MNREVLVISGRIDESYEHLKIERVPNSVLIILIHVRPSHPIPNRLPLYESHLAVFLMLLMILLVIKVLCNNESFHLE